MKKWKSLRLCKVCWTRLKTPKKFYQLPTNLPERTCLLFEKSGNVFHRANVQIGLTPPPTVRFRLLFKDPPPLPPAGPSFPLFTTSVLFKWPLSGWVASFLFAIRLYSNFKRPSSLNFEMLVASILSSSLLDRRTSSLALWQLKHKSKFAIVDLPYSISITVIKPRVI